MAELRSYTPSLRERLQYGIAKMFYGDSREGYHKAQSAIDALDLTPLGVPLQAYDVGRDLASGNFVSAALGGGVLALPAASGVIGRTFGKTAKNIDDPVLGELGALIKQLEGEGEALPGIGPEAKSGTFYEAPQLEKSPTADELFEKVNAAAEADDEEAYNAAMEAWHKQYMLEQGKKAETYFPNLTNGEGLSDKHNANELIDLFHGGELTKSEFLGNITKGELPYILDMLAPGEIRSAAKQLYPDSSKVPGVEGEPGEFYKYKDLNEWINAYTHGVVQDTDFFNNTIQKHAPAIAAALGEENYMAKELMDYYKSGKVPDKYKDKDEFVPDWTYESPDSGPVKALPPEEGPTVTSKTINDKYNDWKNAVQKYGFKSTESDSASILYKLAVTNEFGPDIAKEFHNQVWAEFKKLKPIVDPNKPKITKDQIDAGYAKLDDLWTNYMKAQGEEKKIAGKAYTKASEEHSALLHDFDAQESATAKVPSKALTEDEQALQDWHDLVVNKGEEISSTASANAGIKYFDAIKKQYGPDTATQAYWKNYDLIHAAAASKSKPIVDEVPFYAGFDEIDKWFGKELEKAKQKAWEGQGEKAFTSYGIATATTKKLEEEFKSLGIPIKDEEGDLTESFLDAQDKYAYAWQEALKQYQTEQPGTMEKVADKVMAPFEKAGNKVTDFFEPDYKVGEVPYMTRAMQKKWQGGDNPEFKIPDKAIATEEMLAGLGLDPMVLYHGSGKKMSEFADPAKYKDTHEPALFLSDQKDISRGYNDQVLYPVHANMSNAHVVENFGQYSSSGVNKAIADARALGKDFVILKDMYDVGGKQTQYLSLKPHEGQIRSVWAKMDPAKKHLGDLLAGLGGLSLLTPGVLDALTGDNGEASAAEFKVPPSKNMEDRRGMGTPFTDTLPDQTFHPVSSEWFDQPKVLPYNTVPQEFADQQLNDVMADLQKRDAITSLRKQLQARLKELGQ